MYLWPPSAVRTEARDQQPDDGRARAVQLNCTEMDRRTAATCAVSYVHALLCQLKTAAPPAPAATPPTQPYRKTKTHPRPPISQTASPPPTPPAVLRRDYVGTRARVSVEHDGLCETETVAAGTGHDLGTVLT